MDNNTENIEQSEIKSKSNKKNILLRVALIVIAIVLVLILSIMIIANHYLGKINKVDPDDISVISPDEWEKLDTDDDDYTDIIETSDSEISGTDVDDTSSVITETDINTEPEEDYGDCLVKPINDENLINILLIGQDSASYRARTRTDSMILVSINPDNGKISMISFLRDTYVTIPGGYKSNRLNVPYVIGGFPLLYETLYVNFGIHVDYGFGVNFDGFTKIVDILGGIDIEITERETHYISGVTTGMNHLDGEHALSYARLRHSDSDYGRTNRQRKVLLTIYEKIKNSSLNTINDVINEMLQYMFTDMSKTDIMSLVLKLYKYIGNDIETHYIPPKDAMSQARIGNKAVLVPNLKKINEVLREYLPLD